jgi:cell division septal protein FtsQ
MQDALKVLEICDTTPVGEYLKISRINIGHPEYLDVRLDQGQRVMLARKELGDRLARIAGMVQEDRASGRVASLIDATGENNFTATYR